MPQFTIGRVACQMRNRAKISRTSIIINDKGRVRGGGSGSGGWILVQRGSASVP